MRVNFMTSKVNRTLLSLAITSCVAGALVRTLNYFLPGQMPADDKGVMDQIAVFLIDRRFMVYNLALALYFYITDMQEALDSFYPDSPKMEVSPKVEVETPPTYNEENCKTIYDLTFVKKVKEETDL